MSDAPNSSTNGNSTGQCTSDNSKLDSSNISKNVTAAKKVSKSPLSPWSHEPKTLTLIWLAVAIPVVFLDASFILLRPHTFAGGLIHSPLWKPWDIYQKVDYVYNRSAFNERDGWPSAQALFNLIETSCYVWYMLSVVRYSVRKTGKTAELEGWHLPFGKRTVTGRRGVVMVIVLYGATMVTVVKTALYFLVEIFAGFRHVNHNTPMDLLLLYCIPNGLWLIFPSLILNSSGREMASSLSLMASVV